MTIVSLKGAFLLSASIVYACLAYDSSEQIEATTRPPKMNFTGDLDADVLKLAENRGWLHNCSAESFSITRRSELFSLKYIFPFHFVFGTIGNVLNLCVLLTMNSEMSVANVLFAGMAFADIGLLFSMAFGVIGAWPVFYTKYFWRKLYFSCHFFVHYARNVFLCISSWMVSAVSIERLFSIRDPIRHAQTTSKWRISLIVTGVTIGSMLLCSSHLFEYHYGLAMICNGTLLLGLHHATTDPVYNASQLYLFYIKTSKFLQVTFTVFVPLTLITICNICIIYILRHNRFPTSDSSIASNHDKSLVYRSTSTENARHKRDRKITITVAVIISCYLITHIPSALPFIMELLNEPIPDSWKYNLPTYLTYWLLSGKVMNFVLFCLSSATFRKQLLEFYKRKKELLKRRLGLSGGKKYSIISNGQSVRMTSLQKRRDNNETMNSEYDLDSIKDEPNSGRMRPRQTFSF